MEIPSAQNNKWQEILKSETNYDLEFLGLQILLSRLKISVKLNPSDSNLVKSCSELHNALSKMRHIPKARRDISKLLS